MTNTPTIILAIIFLIIFIELMFLQTRLVLSPVKWHGLVLVAIFGILSLILINNSISFYQESVSIITVLFRLALFNITTFIMWSIYNNAQNNRKILQDIEKMNKQDF